MKLKDGALKGAQKELEPDKHYKDHPIVFSDLVATNPIEAIITSKSFGRKVKDARDLCAKAMSKMTLDQLVNVYEKGTSVIKDVYHHSEVYSFSTTISPPLLRILRDEIVDRDQITAFKLGTKHYLFEFGNYIVSGYGGYDSSITYTLIRHGQQTGETEYYEHYSKCTGYFDEVLKEKAIRKLGNKLIRGSEEEANEALWGFVTRDGIHDTRDEELARLIADFRIKIISKSSDPIAVYESSNNIDLLEIIEGLFYKEQDLVSNRIAGLSDDTKDRLFSLEKSEIISIVKALLPLKSSSEISDSRTSKIEIAYAKAAPAITAYKNLVVGREFSFLRYWDRCVFRTRTSSPLAAEIAIENFVLKEYETAKAELLHIRGAMLEYQDAFFNPDKVSGAFKEEIEKKKRQYGNRAYDHHIDEFLPTSQLGRRLKYLYIGRRYKNDQDIITLLKAVNKEAEKRKDIQWLEPFKSAIYSSRMEYIN